MKALVSEVRPMRIAYLTTDEVNLHLAEEMAAACGLTLCTLDPRDPPPDGEFDALLYDWDHWPAEQQREVMAELLGGSLPHALAVHGYNLGGGRADALRRHTVAVYRLQPRAFRFLRRAVRTVRAARVLGSSPRATARPADAPGHGRFRASFRNA
jgi:hypothetical protein